jgi:predicted PurR-regulated permease PerM
MANSQENPIILTPVQGALDPESIAASAQHSNRFDGIVIGLGAIALVAVASFIIIGVSPFIAISVLFLLLFPFRDYRAARTIMFTAGILVGVWLVVTLASLLFPFIIGLLIAYLFDPIVTWVNENWKVKRGWSALVIVLTLWGLIVLLGMLLIPQIILQVEALLNTISDYFRRSSLTLDEQGIRNFFLSLGLPQKYIDQYITGEIIPQIRLLLGALPKIAVIILTSLPEYAEHILDLIIIPVAAIYFLMDWDIMIQSIQELIPQRQRPAFITTFRGIDKVLYGYIRGQSTVAVIIGTLGAIAFMILGVPYAALLGLLIALLDLIPFIGLIFSIIIVEGVVLLTMPITFGSIFMALAVIAGLHLFENYFLGPRIVGKGVGIPPVLIIISIFVFGYFLGLLGMLIAVPLTGIILLFIREYRQALVEHPL